MTILQTIKGRFSKFAPILATVAVLGTAGGYAAHEYAAGDCCSPGAACCHPGAACCAARHRAQH